MAAGLIGLLLGAVAAVEPVYAAIGVAVVVLGVVFIQARVHSELVVAAYWLTFTGVSTVFREADVDGAFFPFYGALLFSVAVALWRRGLRLDRRIAWVYGAFLVVLLLSLLAPGSVAGGDSLRRLIVYPFGALVLFQFGSATGLRAVALTAIGTSLAVSCWVIVTAFQAGFTYRGDLDVDQNVVSFYIGLGLMLLLARRLDGARATGTSIGAALDWLAVTVMAYATLVLASRGTIIAISLTLLALFVRELMQAKRRLGVFAALLVVGTMGFILPGGQGLLERFEETGVDTGGGRTLIWSVVIDGIMVSRPSELLVGHGFGASRELVGARFTSLSSPHNAYLQVFFDLGLVGLVLFLALHGLVVVRAWSVPGREGAQMLGLVVFLLAVNLSITAQDNFLYWTALGLALAMSSWFGRDQARRPQEQR